VLAVARGEVDLIAHLADEADAQDEALHARDQRLLAVQVGERLVGAVQVGDRGHDLAGLGPGQVDRPHALGDVREMDPVAPVGQPPGEPLLDRAGAARGVVT
jgi:hypothetical protein